MLYILKMEASIAPLSLMRTMELDEDTFSECSKKTVPNLYYSSLDTDAL